MDDIYDFVPLEVMDVKQVAGTAISVEFNDGTYACYTSEELRFLRPLRRRLEPLPQKLRSRRKLIVDPTHGNA